MPLPTDNVAWPPPEHAGVLADMAEADAWYSGDPDKLTSFYSGAQGTRPSERAGRLSSAVSGLAKFWSRGPNGTSRQRVHVPAAADIAATSADLLFGDEPRITIPGAHQETAEKGAIGTEDRLAEIIELDGITSTLLEAAEVAAGISGVYLRPVWDHDVADHPMLTVVHGDRGLPEFTWGKLTAVTFWTEVQVEANGVVWRHLERHEDGVILHGLYAGTKDKLGVRMGLDALAATRSLAGDHGDGVILLPEGIDGILPRYVPNVLPNRKRRGRPVGRADTAGTEALMDGLDEAMSSWMRDIRLGKGRIVVPQEFLERTGRGRGASFDMDAEVFAPLDIDPSNAEKAGITPVQFAIRTQEHADTCADLFERIVTGSGYSPATFGLAGGEGGTMTATEVAAKEARSFRTTTRKQRYWSTALVDSLENLLIIDRAEFGSGVVPMRPRVEFAELGQQDIREVASTLNLINLAQAASVETKVKLLNPDLDEAEVRAEVARITDELGLNAPDLPDPTGGLP